MNRDPTDGARCRSGVGFGFCPRGTDQVAEIASDEGIAFFDFGEFRLCAGAPCVVATDNEDEFFGLPVHGEIEVFVADPPKRD